MPSIQRTKMALDLPRDMENIFSCPRKVSSAFPLDVEVLTIHNKEDGVVLVWFI